MSSQEGTLVNDGSVIVSKSGGTYTANVETNGTFLRIGSSLTIPGASLGGQTPQNDAVVTVTSTDEYGGIKNITASGTSKSSYSITLPSQTVAIFSATSNDAGTGYNPVVMLNEGSGYGLNTSKLIRVTAPGGNFVDDTITVTDVDTNGSVQGILFSSEPPTQTYNITITEGGSEPANVVVTVKGSTYSATVGNWMGNTDPNAWPYPGRGFGRYVPGPPPIWTGVDMTNRVRVVSGTLLGGTSPDNDLIITIQGVGSNVGEIQSIFVSGTARPYTFSPLYITPVSYVEVPIKTYTPASFTITLNGATYSSTIITQGENYYPGEIYKVSGELLGGISPENDAFITITETDGNHRIDAATISGVSNRIYGPFTLTSSSSGYRFTLNDIRDGSDWIAYKKQLLIKKEVKVKTDPWIIQGNDYRLQYLLGDYKLESTCSSCDANAISGAVRTIIPIDFSVDTNEGDPGIYKEIQIDTPTNEITFIMNNLPEGSMFYEIDSDTYDFSTLQSKLFLHGRDDTGGYDEPYFFLQYAIYSNSLISSGTEITLVCNPSISGTLHIGVYTPL